MYIVITCKINNICNFKSTVKVKDELKIEKLQINWVFFRNEQITFVKIKRLFLFLMPNNHYEQKYL